MIIDYDQIAKLLESNFEVKMRQESLNSSKVKISTIASTFIPEVAVYTQTENSELGKIGKTPTAGVYANVNLFNGFRDVEQNKINNLSYEANNLEYKKSYNELVFKARKYYFEALKVMENIKILTEHEKVNKNNRDQIQRRVSSGLSPKSEELIFKKIELGLKEDRVKEDNELKIIQINLKNILSLDKNEKIELSGDLDITKFQYVQNQNQIELKIAETNENQVNSEQKMASLWRMPRVNFYAEKSFTNHVNGEYLEEDDDKLVVGIRLTMPIFSGKNNESTENQIMHTEIKAAILRRKSELRDIESNNEKIELQLSHLKNMIEISNSKVELAKEIMNKTFSEFKLGLKEAISLNEATEDYLEARKDLNEHKIEYILNIEESKINKID